MELKNIIDKLANFVARNGPEFEQMTMNKQRDNPKFQFLFGGEWHAYYKWRVASEQQQSQGPRLRKCCFTKLEENLFFHFVQVVFNLHRPLQEE